MTDALLDHLAFVPPAAQRARLAPIPWPDGWAPVTGDEHQTESDPLPACDVLIVTYTAAEGHALADVLSPGHDTSRWVPYRNGWDTLKALIEGHRAPALESDCAGLWTEITVGPTRVVLMKSELHPATDGPKLPMAAFWRQMLTQTGARLVLTTGTAGGIGARTLLGDVIVSRHVQWDCTEQFAHEPWAGDTYVGPRDVDAIDEIGLLQTAEGSLLPVNAGHLPSAPRGPRIITYGDVITTDFFAFDDAEDHFGLRTFDRNALAVEMDDAALGVALAGFDTPNLEAWFSVRNASDPQIPQGSSIEAEDKQAAAIYQHYGYWTTVNSAITCWALAAALGRKP